MSEETIINGIDVSECCADNKMMKDGLYCFWEGGSCADNEFCYYKQLKRLQEENEKLKGKINIYENSIIANHDRAVGKRLMEVLLALEEIKEDLEQDTTCESRECGCDDYGECLKCVKETILDTINEVLKQ